MIKYARQPYPPSRAGVQGGRGVRLALPAGALNDTGTLDKCVVAQKLAEWRPRASGRRLFRVGDHLYLTQCHADKAKRIHGLPRQGRKTCSRASYTVRGKHGPHCIDGRPLIYEVDSQAVAGMPERKSGRTKIAPAAGVVGIRVVISDGRPRAPGVRGVVKCRLIDETTLSFGYEATES